MVAARPIFEMLGLVNLQALHNQAGDASRDQTNLSNARSGDQGLVGRKLLGLDLEVADGLAGAAICPIG